MLVVGLLKIIPSADVYIYRVINNINEFLQMCKSFSTRVIVVATMSK